MRGRRRPPSRRIATRCGDRADCRWSVRDPARADGSALGSQRAITFLSTFFGIVALLLSALGLYGMLSSNVSQRTAEIGIRSALGASRGSIMRMILSEVFRLAVLGPHRRHRLFVTIRFIDKMLYGVTSFDWPTLVGVGVTLAMVILLASFWPARRAASVDPLIAIRTD